MHRRSHVDECDKTFTSRENMNAHRRIHTGEKPFVCPDCSKKFRQKGHFNEHRRTHTGEKPFACPDCDKKFKRSNDLKKHRRNHAGEKPFACLDCDKTFISSNDLNKHRRIHNGEKPFDCPDCGKKFRHKGHFNEHRRIHTGEKPFACPDCDKKFKRSNDLKKHRRNHTGEKPFAYLDCDKTFISSTDLNEHRRIHTGEKPFVCPDCNETFSFDSILHEHRKIHRNEKSVYSTPEREVTRSNRNHTGNVNPSEQMEVSHNEEKQFICHVCEEAFSQESLLENHVKVHPDAADFLCERNFLNFIEQRKLCRSNHHSMPVHTDDMSIVPSECEMTWNASSGNCVLDGKVDDGDVHIMNANQIFDSTVSLIGNSTQTSELFLSIPGVPVPSGANECRVICSGDCLLDVKDELGDVDRHAGNSSVSEGSLKIEDEADSFKLYGCGICCQSFSTKEETVHCFNSH